MSKLATLKGVYGPKTSLKEFAKWQEVKRAALQARVQRYVRRFAQQHPDFDRVQGEVARLIERYDCTLEGAYRVASERAKCVQDTAE
jgi:hypothetical protein